MEKFIKKLVKIAGNYLLEKFKKNRELIQLRASFKTAVTKYDKTVDQLIIERIKKEYPAHNIFILTEESSFIKSDSDCLWIVDSLDRTGNFANGNPLFSVCIALMEKEELKLGTIYSPTIGEFYFAKKSKEAYFNQRKIKVSNLSGLNKSYIFYCEGNEKDRKKLAKVINKVYPRVTELRKISSAGLENAWVALERGEAYWTLKIDPWDVVPGVLLIEEAGGKVTDF